MKRPLAVTLFVIALAFALAAPAMAAWHYSDGGVMTWRTYKASASSEIPNATLISGTAYYCDTSYVTLGVTANQGVIDTTATWRFPNDFCLAGAPDSMPPVILQFQLSSALASSGESLYCAIEPTVLGGVYSPTSGGYAGSYIGQAAAPTVALKCGGGTAVASIIRVFPAGSAAAFAGSETWSSGSPVNTAFIPGFGMTGGFRIRLWVDDGGLTGTTTPTLKVGVRYLVKD